MLACPPREYACAVKSLGLDELSKLGEVLLGLTGEADDKGGADSNVGDLLLNLCKHLADKRAVSVAVHALEHLVADVLKGKIDVVENSGIVLHLLDKTVGDLVGVAVENSDPRNARFLCNFMQKLVETVLAVKVDTVASGVLRDDGQLLDAHLVKLFCLFNKLVHRARTELSTNIGDSAVGATVVASLADL